ncbi:MAG: hypothetical protein HN348_29170, partial [Proteobacteria bacterium]|nr:hypothetical protein [Pseudomonadota bacterium]
MNIFKPAPLVILLACQPQAGPDENPTDSGIGLLGEGLLNPYPSVHLMADDLLNLPEIEPGGQGTKLPVDEMDWRNGFSPSQTAIVSLETVNTDALPYWQEPTPGEGGVLLVDLTDGAFLPVMAELDAHPDADPPVLVIRPLTQLPFNHRIAVVITTDTTERPQRFDDLIGGNPPSSLADYADHYETLIDDLSTLQISTESIALAFDFPVSDPTITLTSALDQLDPLDTYEFRNQRDLDNGDVVAPYTWRVAEGVLGVQDFLIDDERLDRNDDGTVNVVGTTDADLYVHIPTSVQDAAEGTVPIMVFGHGIFSKPGNYLDQSDDPSGVNQLAEEGGFIVIATVWRGLTWKDRADVVAAANDIGLLPSIPDRLVQGQIATQSLIHHIREGSLLDDDVFLGRSGQKLPNPDQLVYYGISLGGIEGAVLAANTTEFDAAVLHVPGSQWSTMLERSSNWTAFELFVANTVPDAAERQLLYSLSQLWWDPVDPMSYAHALVNQSILLQESIGDEQVPN